MRYFKEVISLDDEGTVEPVEPQRNENDKQEDSEIIKEKMRNWCVGVAFSFLPLIVQPIAEFLDDKNVCTTFYNLFCDISIMFIGISFSVTAFNDFVEFKKSNKGNWVAGHLALIIVGVIFYTVVKVEEYKKITINMDKVFWFNLVYFIAVFGVTVIKYIREIRGVR